MESLPSGFAELQRILRKKPVTPGERCDFCAVALSANHGHMIDLTARRIMCSCRPCALVFQPSGAAQGRFKAIPSRYVEVPDFGVSDADWDSLQIPIGLAFFFRNSAEQRTVAFYPGPAGATESQLDLAAFEGIVERYPVLGTIEADVEAILVQRERGTARCFIVPIDAAYELVGTLRTGWRGFDGGTEVRGRIEEFFVKMSGRSRGRVEAPRS